MNVIFFPNGNTAVFDEDGKQIPQLQKSWILLFAEHLRDQNIDPLKADYTMPDGSSASLFKTSDGSYNWRIT